MVEFGPRATKHPDRLKDRGEAEVACEGHGSIVWFGNVQNEAVGCGDEDGERGEEASGVVRVGGMQRSNLGPAAAGANGAVALDFAVSIKDESAPVLGVTEPCQEIGDAIDAAGFAVEGEERR